MAVATLFAFAVPILVQVFLDSVVGTEPLPPFPWAHVVVGWLGGVPALRTYPLRLAAAMAAAAIVNGAFSYVAARWMAIGAEQAAQSTRIALYDHLHRVSVAYHRDATSGDLIQRCTSDVDTLRRFFAVQIIEVGRAIAMVAIAVPIMVRLDPPLALVSVAILPWAFWYTYRFFLNMESAFLASDESEGRLSARIQEYLVGIRVVRAFGRVPHEVARFSDANGEYTRLSVRMIDLLARYWCVSSFLVMVQLAAVVIYGTVRAIAGEVTVGALLVFITAELMLLWPVREMGMILADMGKARVAAGRINEILTQPTEDEDPVLRGPGMKRPQITGEIEFRDVGFSYGEVATLDGVSFRVAPGESIGVLGPTGAGKSTLMLLLARLYDPTAGTILVDGVDILEIERRWMRRHLGFVLQEPFLYAKTLRDNIALSKSHAPDSHVHGVARQAAIHDVIVDFRQGYDTPVGERGVTLSGGQKQRVAIARALLTGAPILVFDDSLSAVDTTTDAQIRSALLATRSTTFLISHRIVTLMRCDRVLVLDHGRIIEQGTPTELCARGGEFARVAQLQSGGSHADVS
jgi:ATP-binding cassette subfamily B protein